MPFYMFTASYKPEAIKAMVNDPQDRGEAVKPLMAELGITLHHLFFMLGKDDIVAIMEGPDDETAAAGSMIIAASGAFSGGAITKLMTTADAVTAMKKAGSAMSTYSPPTR
jgi:uncharacterized protein with GYD domain